MKWTALLAGALLLTSASALLLDINSKDSICEAAKAVQQGEWNYYEGTTKGGTVGMFTPPYYWWHAGEAFGGLIDYYTFCDPTNDTLKDLIFNGMYHQAGDDFNYIPSNQSMTEGNDDQGVWGLAIMQAAERNFTDPPDHSWLSMTQAVYNTMNARWDTQYCNGGLRWQIFTWNSGYDYKNSIANGCLFHLAARLARYTGNLSYADTAVKVWDWMSDVGFATYKDGTLVVYDGAKIGDNCTQLTTSKWSYTYGIFLAGTAYMYDYSNDTEWEDRANEILKSSDYFFNETIMTEKTCQLFGTCNNDQRSFRSLFSRCLGLTASLVPSTRDVISKFIEPSAQGAAQSCSGGSDGVTCGQNWNYNGWDGFFGLGEQMSALECIQALLTMNTSEPQPYTADNGGSSKSNPDAGLNTQDQTNKQALKITGKDKAGAGVLTAVALGVILGGAIWMVL